MCVGWWTETAKLCQGKRTRAMSAWVWILLLMLLLLLFVVFVSML
jgi:hypothetical protein